MFLVVPQVRLDSAPMLLSVDVAIAAVAAAGCAPVMGAIDKAITLSAAGKQPLWSALRADLRVFLRRPVPYVRSPVFLWLWFVYASIYASSSAIDTLCAARGVSSAFPVLVTSTFMSVSCGLVKDTVFARTFGARSTKVRPI
eukprot:6611508-Prymnesium_polylepis.1